jgi:uncharacterized membrane protein
MNGNDKPRRRIIEILILVLTAIVGFYIVSATIIVFVTELRDPRADTSDITNRLSDIVTGILVALLGLIAGRSQSHG